MGTENYSSVSRRYIDVFRDITPGEWEREINRPTIEQEKMREFFKGHENDVLILGPNNTHAFVDRRSFPGAFPEIEEGGEIIETDYDELLSYVTPVDVFVTVGGRNSGKTALIAAISKLIDSEKEYTPADVIDAPGFNTPCELEFFNLDYDIPPLPDTRKNWQNKFEKQFSRKGKR